MTIRKLIYLLIIFKRTYLLFEISVKCVEIFRTCEVVFEKNSQIKCLKFVTGFWKSKILVARQQLGANYFENSTIG